MASVVNRYGTSYFGYTIMKTAPRIMALTVAGAIGLECVGSGFVDALWDSVNKGVRDRIQGCKRLASAIHRHTAHSLTLFDLLSAH
jgi:hypothetical protein